MWETESPVTREHHATDEGDMSPPWAASAADEGAARLTAMAELEELAPAENLLLVQDWTTLSSGPGSLVAQDVSGYADLTDIVDLTFYMGAALPRRKKWRSFDAAKLGYNVGGGRGFPGVA